MDVPNDRSSHSVPVSKAGGIAIVGTFLAGILAIYIFAGESMIREPYFIGFVCSALLVAIISFYDDVKGNSFLFRFFIQAIAATVVMVFGMVISEFEFPLDGRAQLGISKYVITFLWIVGLTNAYNFMDGINGLAAGTAVIAGLFFGIISFGQGSDLAYIISCVVVAGTLGFFVFNFPRARLFMGDVGSTFLGFVFATLAIIAALYDHSHTSFFVMPLLLFHFIYDAFFTFLRRLIRGENVFLAHRTHLYQLFVGLGYSHTKVSIFYFAVGIIQGFGAWWMVHMYGDKRVLVFIPYLLFQVAYSFIIIKKAKNGGLL
ncbi:MAG: glycosyltransferase family 4 protein [Syntrophales bacterium]|nr:glycosyltransferase family 4 protein [Syntrophales bacterium]